MSDPGAPRCTSPLARRRLCPDPLHQVQQASLVRALPVDTTADTALPEPVEIGSGTRLETVGHGGLVGILEEAVAHHASCEGPEIGS